METSRSVLYFELQLARMRVLVLVLVCVLVVSLSRLVLACLVLGGSLRQGGELGGFYASPVKANWAGWDLCQRGRRMKCMWGDFCVSFGGNGPI